MGLCVGLEMKSFKMPPHRNIGSDPPSNVEAPGHYCHWSWSCVSWIVHGDGLAGGREMIVAIIDVHIMVNHCDWVL